MNFYMVVQIDDEGMFEDEPEYFDTKYEAVKQRDQLAKDHPDLTFALIRCEEVP